MQRKRGLVLAALLAGLTPLATAAPARPGRPDSGVVAAQAQTPAQASKTLYVRCGRLVYDTEKPPRVNVDLVITGDKITAIGSDLPVPAGAEQVDLSKDTVLPGFLDAHIHLFTGTELGVAGPTPSAPLAALRAQKDMAYALSLGIVAVRVVGSADFIDVALGNAIDQGAIPGPHVVPAGHAISIPAGHGDHFTFPESIPLEQYYTPLNGFINSPADAERAVHLQIKYGAKVIKVLASGGVGSPLDSPSAEQVSQEELNVICEEAHMDGIKVAAHAENIRSILAALHAGVDSIEHGSQLNQEAIDYFKSHPGVYLDPTLYVVENILQNGQRLHMADYVLRKARALSVLHFASFTMALQAGVAMAAGSDQSYRPGTGTVLDEMIALVGHGMTAEQALTAATKHNAALLGLDQLGMIAVGKEASLVAVAGNPLADIHAVKSTRAVIFEGRVVPLATLKASFAP
ncbi:MAG TPA: amidohydrolase family protein [Candidatus Acidoferrales bacterium]|nr:amidohydrolase family protein [Candidatus Acidoferrales bacterium]